MKLLKKIAIRILIIIASAAIVLTLVIVLFLEHPKFGRAPSGIRLERIMRSPNYRAGRFQNTTLTPTFAEGHTFWQELRKSIFTKYPGRTPTHTIPVVKTDLTLLSTESDFLIWFGHSSCFIHLEGKRILIDPVFSTNASPVPGSVKAFEGTGIFTVSDLPDIDYVLISHDHYDHLDYETMLALKTKTTKVICGLGVGSHLERWGYGPDQIIEKDWHEKVSIDSAFAIHTEPARHKSGRGVSQNNTLWLSFLIRTSQLSIYISGDTGFDRHFSEIGHRFGPIDLAIMETGQYDSAWRYVHLLPEETIKAAHELKARSILPVHHSKFVLGRHRWDDPLTQLAKLDTASRPLLVTPMIGEVMSLNDRSQTFGKWWERVDKIN